MEYVDMIRGVLTRARGCPEDEAIDAMRNACMEFCRETRCLTGGITVTATGVETPVSQLVTQVVDVIDATIDGEPVVLITHLNDPRISDLADDEYALRWVDPGFVELTPAPTVDSPVTIELVTVTAPGPESTGVQEVLWAHYSEDLRHGALSRVLSVPGNAWTNTALAQYHELKWMAALAKAEADHGKNREQPGRRLRVRPV